MKHGVSCLCRQGYLIGKDGQGKIGRHGKVGLLSNMQCFFNVFLYGRLGQNVNPNVPTGQNGEVNND